MEGIATAKPLQSHPDPSEHTMFSNGINHVFGAGWIKTAGGRQ
jgi:hypothetical protein